MKSFIKRASVMGALLCSSWGFAGQIYEADEASLGTQGQVKK